MCVDITHLVFEAPAYPNDEVVYDSLDSTKCGHVLAGTMVQFDINDAFRRLGEAD